VALLGLVAFVAGLVMVYLRFRKVRSEEAREAADAAGAADVAGTVGLSPSGGGGTGTLVKGRAPARNLKVLLAQELSWQLLVGGAAVAVVAWLVSLVVSAGRLFALGPIEMRSNKAIIIVSAVLMMVLLDVFVNRTKLGRGIRSTAQDPETAVLMGVNIDRVVTATFALGGAMAGVAAALWLMRFEDTEYLVGFLLGIKAFTAAVLGGIGNLRGALVGGLVLGLLEMYGSALFGPEWRDVVAFVVLVLVLMFRPTGILGESLQRARA
jgi:branched-subunit amino acid ABC-type transport system permease component